MAIADYSIVTRFSADAPSPASDVADALAFARADMAIRLARREALLGDSYDSEAYDAAIEQRRAARQRVEAAKASPAPVAVAPLRFRAAATGAACLPQIAG